jgi:hypothetical protein
MQDYIYNHDTNLCGTAHAQATQRHCSENENNKGLRQSMTSTHLAPYSLSVGSKIINVGKQQTEDGEGITRLEH